MSRSHPGIFAAAIEVKVRMPSSPRPESFSFRRDKRWGIPSQECVGLRRSPRTMGLAVVVKVQIETKPFHLGVHVATKTDGFADMFMKILSEFSIKVVDRE